MSKKSEPVRPALSKIAVDSMARRWSQIAALEGRLAEKKDRLKDDILRSIRQHGEVAPNAKTMRVLRGLLHEIQATFPTETSVDAKAARKFLQAVPYGLGKRLFDRSEKFTLRPGAWELAAVTITSAHLAELFALAVQRSDGAPRVKVVKLKKQNRAA